MQVHDVQVSIRRPCVFDPRPCRPLIWMWMNNVLLENHRENKTHHPNACFRSWFMIDTTFSHHVITFYICPVNKNTTLWPLYPSVTNKHALNSHSGPCVNKWFFRISISMEHRHNTSDLWCQSIVVSGCVMLCTYSILLNHQACLKL